VIEVGGAFSEPQIRIEDQVTADDRVVTRWSFTAHHDGEMYGIPATGRHVRFTGIDIHRVAGGRIVEEWSEWDALGFMRQLGVIPEEATA
jgi:predicted ester cyclase